jgi:hypothetical protein
MTARATMVCVRWHVQADGAASETGGTTEGGHTSALLVDQELEVLAVGGERGEASGANVHQLCSKRAGGRTYEEGALARGEAVEELLPAVLLLEAVPEEHVPVRQRRVCREE